eukprot:1298250-Amphidinium_carterae.1
MEPMKSGNIDWIVACRLLGSSKKCTKTTLGTIMKSSTSHSSMLCCKRGKDSKARSMFWMIKHISSHIASSRR